MRAGFSPPCRINARWSSWRTGRSTRILRGLWRGLDGLASLALDEPQDGFYRLDPQRRERFIPADVAPREGAGSS